MTEQLAIKFARRSDPQTSHDAAERAMVFRSTHEGKIYGALLQAGERGATAKEIAAVTPLTDVQANRRLCAMDRRGLITRNALFHLSNEEFEYEQRGGCSVWRVCA